jgi:D-alanyl-D-alanine carboxypeptidase
MPKRNGEVAMSNSITRNKLIDFLDRYAGSEVPGLQYAVIGSDETLFEYAGGWADIRNQRLMTSDTTMMGYSMTKTFTAVAVMQLVEQGRLSLDDKFDLYTQNTPYRGRHITIRHLLTHTSGIPNPIPLRWVHLTDEHVEFDEDAALAQILQENPKLDFEPGDRFSYSNIGYWLLGKVVERMTGQAFIDYVRNNVLNPLLDASDKLGFVVLDPIRLAKGYLSEYSFLNLAKGFFTDSKFWGGYEGNWLRQKSHYLNGPAFGGLVGTARGFSHFLQDQLRSESILFNRETKKLLETQQKNHAGKLVTMTLGWHVGQTNGVYYYFKEGGGGGFRSEMRIYPSLGLGSIVMTNSTIFGSNKFLNRVDNAFV